MTTNILPEDIDSTMTGILKKLRKSRRSGLTQLI